MTNSVLRGMYMDMDMDMDMDMEMFSSHDEQCVAHEHIRAEFCFLSN